MIYEKELPDPPPPYSISSTPKSPVRSSKEKRQQQPRPSSYPIGNHALSQPLVQINELKGHLSLLKAFKSLRTAVEEAALDLLPKVVQQLRLDKERRWAWFVSLAVERFQRWVETYEHVDGVDKWIEHTLPPIDVLMVWHSYMLNPSWYTEDCERLKLLAHFRYLTDKLLLSVERVGDICAYTASERRKESWTEKTRTHFDPLQSASSDAFDRIIECPKCLKSCTIPFMTTTGTGYSQVGFTVTCAGCQLKLDKSVLGLALLCKDLVRNYTSFTARLSDAPGHSSDLYLAGTLHTPYRVADTDKSHRIKKALLTHYKLLPTSKSASEEDKLEDSQSIMRSVQYDARLFKRDALTVFNDFKVVGRVLSPYADDRPFSIDLVAAVLRQGSFIEKMHGFGWTTPGYFDDANDEAVLVHATARYHAFLDLLSSSPGSFFVPTLDIDLVWHTHQLMGSQYGKDCYKYVGRYIDHDDKVEKNHLSNSFDLTCRAWQQRFKVRYTYCGCPLPYNEKTKPTAAIGQKLGWIKQHLSSRDSDLQGISSGILLSSHPPSRQDAQSATHASEHNCMEIYLTVGLEEQKTQESTSTSPDHQQKKDEKSLESTDPKKREKGDLSRESNRDSESTHIAAFLFPVPLYDPPGASLCVAPCGGVIKKGAAPCAVGAGQCSNSACATTSYCTSSEAPPTHNSTAGGSFIGTGGTSSQSGDSTAQSLALGAAISFGTFSDVSTSSGCGTSSVGSTSACGSGSGGNSACSSGSSGCGSSGCGGGGGGGCGGS
ncbi:hypothetical protein C8Q75DRAFT_805098 [Abortiporus biennis]|nr:hypothetical protein C8Q75DRAFT_805098 [Abortiporus biennis]